MAKVQRFTVTQDGAYQKRNADLGAQIVQRGAAQDRVGTDDKFSQLNAPLAEGVDLGGGGGAEHAVDLLGNGKLGIDGQGEIHFILHQLHQPRVFGIADAGDGMRRAQLARGGAGKDIDLVSGGNGDQQIGTLGTRAAQNGDVGTVADDAENVTGVGKLGQRGVVGVYDGQIVPFAGELSADGGTDRAGTDDDNFHKCVLRR